MRASRNCGAVCGVVAGALGCVAALSTNVAAAHAQPGIATSGTAGRVPVRLVEGREDTGPLATSSQMLPMDLRAPTGFEHVYRAPGADGTLMRISGGLVATFPRSQYDVREEGIVPVIPAGTVFHIGPSAGAGGSPWAPASFGFEGSPWRDGASVRPGNAIDLRALVPPPPAMRTADPAGPRSIWEDEFYRSVRLRALLAEAAPAEGMDRGTNK